MDSTKEWLVKVVGNFIAGKILNFVYVVFTDKENKYYYKTVAYKILKGLVTSPHFAIFYLFAIFAGWIKPSKMFSDTVAIMVLFIIIAIVYQRQDRRKIA